AACRRRRCTNPPAPSAETSRRATRRLPRGVKWSAKRWPRRRRPSRSAPDRKSDATIRARAAAAGSTSIAAGRTLEQELNCKTDFAVAHSTGRLIGTAHVCASFFGGLLPGVLQRRE